MPKSLGLSKDEMKARRAAQQKARNARPESKIKRQAYQDKKVSEDPGFNARRSKKWRSKQSPGYFKEVRKKDRPRLFKFYWDHRDEILPKARKWRQENPERRQEAELKSNRKIRNLPKPTRPCLGICEICKKPETRLNKRGVPVAIALDHCHNKGHFRGWLCFRCNTTIGRAEDDIELLQAMIDYIKNDLANQANLESIKEVA